MRHLRAWTGWRGAGLACCVLMAGGIPAGAAVKAAPNVVVIVTDDQGFGDVGLHGNGKIRTPNLDRLGREGIRLTQFHVSPVCAPTRASLMTGRYNYRTGVTDTYAGRALMDPREVTLGEVFGRAGYRTGLFGKWHLGDNYPMRAMDQGFQETLVLNGGGLVQAGDPPEGGGYYDPRLRRNGEWVRRTGYVSDVLTDAALAFLEADRDRPFFCWLAFNAPHAPLQAPTNLVGRYQEMNLRPEDFPSTGQPIAGKFNADFTARTFAMVENVDENVGRVLAKLDWLGVSTNTLVIFLTDNGPQEPRYNAGMRGLKGSPFEGGIRVPFFLRWPGGVKGGREVDVLAAHIDLMPTLLELCGVAPPRGVSFDGVSLAGVLREEGRRVPDRTLFIQWHRGDVPERFRGLAVLSPEWKLVQPGGTAEGAFAGPMEFMLFRRREDPFEQNDLAAQQPAVVDRLRSEYERWFRDVTGRRDFSMPPKIQVGSTAENPVRLSRQDWRGRDAGWGPASLGRWAVEIVQPGDYEITVRFGEVEQAGTAQFNLGKISGRAKLQPGESVVVWRRVRLSAGSEWVRAWREHGGKQVGAHYVEMRLIEPKGER